MPLAFFGVIWAIYNISVGLVGKQVHRLEHRIGPIPLLIALSLLPVLGYFGLGLSSTTVGIVIGLVFYISRGITQVLLKDAMNWRIPNHYRATANSMQSFFFRLGFAAVGPIVGYGIDSYGMTTVMVSLGTMFLLLFVVATVPLIWELKKLHLTEIPQARTS